MEEQTPVPDRPAQSPAGRELRVAVVAAMEEEIESLVQRLEAPRRESADRWQVTSGRLGAYRLALAATGEGSAAAAGGVDALLAGFPADLLLVVGIAGGLTPDLDAGTLVVAREVWNGSAVVPPPDPGWVTRLSRPAGVQVGRVVSSERIATGPEEKRRLWRECGEEGTSGVVDLESATWARAAVDRRLPYAVVRAVSDTADEELPLDLNRFRDADGRVDRAAVARHAAFRPALWRRLLTLRDRVAACADGLASTVEEALTR